MGKDVVFEIHPGAGHAFTNEENVLGTYDADLTAKTWASTIAFLARASAGLKRPGQAPSARSIAGGISSRPCASSCARSMLIVSRGLRSGQLSHGPGGIAPATQ